MRGLACLSGLRVTIDGMKKLLALAVPLALVGCAAVTDAPVESSTPSPSPSQAVVSNAEACAAYLPTSDGGHAPLVQEIVDMYVSGSVESERVSGLLLRIVPFEDAASPDVADAIVGVNQPIHNMRAALDAGQASFSNQWDAPAAMTAVMEVCSAPGYVLP